MESEKRVRFPVKKTVFAVVILAMFLAGYYRRMNRRPFAESIEVMGTWASVKFFDSDQDTDRKAADAVWQIFRGVNDRFSNYNPESELSRMNATAHETPFKCSDEMWKMLTVCREAYSVSHGAFDVTTAPIVKLWGIYRKEKETLPPPEEIDAALGKVGMDKVVFDDDAKTVQFKVEGMSIDVGGIAKGYAVDKAVEAVQGFGITRGIIDLGGNLACLTEAPHRKDAYVIGIRNPFAPRTMPVVKVEFKGKAIATSGDYERYVEIDGKRYAHIMDVTTGKPVTGMAAVSVIADKAVVTDMLSTTIFITGETYMDELLKKYPGTKVLMVKTDDPDKPVAVSYPQNDPFWEDVTDPKSWMPTQ